MNKNVGGLAKCSIRRYVGTGSKVLNATDCKDFLGTKFAEKTNPNFFLKLIDVDDLAGSQAEARSKIPDDWRLRQLSSHGFSTTFHNF